MLAIYQEVYEKMINDLSTTKEELIGIIGGCDEHIIHFQMDLNPNSDLNQCSLSENSISVVENWNRVMPINLLGIVHSHPNGCNKLSLSDIQYALEMIRLNSLSCLLMGIVENHLLWLYEVSPVGRTIIREYIIE